MLRVGLTGGLGSGKSTVGTMLARRGAYLLQADEIGRELMRAGTTVFRRIVEQFGPGVVRADGELDRAELARMAFGGDRDGGGGRGEELNAIVHPAVIARQAEMAERIERSDPGAVLVLVTAEDRVKVERYVARAAGTRPAGELEAEARARLRWQMGDGEKAGMCDFVLANDGSVDDLEAKASSLWEELRRRAASETRSEP